MSRFFKTSNFFSNVFTERKNQEPSKWEKWAKKEVRTNSVIVFFAKASSGHVE